MNYKLTSIRVIKNLLKKYQIYPSKKFGQNFLINQSVLKAIIQVANLKFKDTVLEIGPGLGTLTKELAKRARKVIAIEKDPKMVEILRELVQNLKNIEIIRADILKFLGHKRNAAVFKLWPDYKVVANLPYYLTSHLIRRFLEMENRPKEMILMVQKEVAQRICASPPKMNLLAVSVQFYAKAEIISFVSKRAFWPQPRVDSAIIKIVPRPSSSLGSAVFRQRFFRIVRAGFSQPRKQIVNSLSNILNLEKNKVKTWLLENGLSLTQRPETLKIEQWIKIAESRTILGKRN